MGYLVCSTVDVCVCSGLILAQQGVVGEVRAEERRQPEGKKKKKPPLPPKHWLHSAPHLSGLISLSICPV